VICDPRMSERAYGRIFRASLPPMAMTRDGEVALQRLRELAGSASAGAGPGATAGAASGIAPAAATHPP